MVTKNRARGLAAHHEAHVGPAELDGPGDGERFGMGGHPLAGRSPTLTTPQPVCHPTHDLLEPSDRIRDHPLPSHEEPQLRRLLDILRFCTIAREAPGDVAHEPGVREKRLGGDELGRTGGRWNVAHAD